MEMPPRRRGRPRNPVLSSVDANVSHVQPINIQKTVGQRASTDESVVTITTKAIQPQEVTKSKKGGRFRKQEPESLAMSFKKHWDDVNKSFDGLTNAECDTSVINMQTIDYISKWSAKEGLVDNELKVIWALVSDKRSTLNEDQKNAFLYALVPKEKLHEDLTREILRWLYKESGKFSASLVNSVLMMLYGWNIYDLVETKLFSNPVTYNRFVDLCKDRVEVLPWLSVLVRKITTAKLVSKANINLLYAISEKRITETITNCVSELLHYYQYLRPDLFPSNPSYLKWSRRSFDGIQLTLPTKLKLSLYEAKKRISKEVKDVSECSDDDAIKRQSIEAVSQINRKFFEEFGPMTQVDVNITSLQLLNRHEAMLIMLRKEETIPLLACDAEALELFDIWANLVFFHRFPFYNQEDNEKYVFILDRCLRLSMFLNASLYSVTKWLIDFLPSWDGILFEYHVRELLRYMPLHTFSAECGSFFAKLKLDFARGETLARLRIWNVLDAMIQRWPEMVKGDHDDAYANELGEKTKEAAEKFFLELLSLIRKFISVDGYKDLFVLRNMCDSYEKIVINYSDERVPVKPRIPEELAYMAILCDKIEVLESCTKLYTTLSSITKQKKYTDSNEFKREMFFFYAKKENAAPFMSLFRAEYEAICKKEELLGEVEENTVNIKGVMSKLTCYYSDALREFSADPTLPFPINFKEDNFRWQDLKTKAPYVYRNLGHLGRQKMARKHVSGGMEA